MKFSSLGLAAELQQAIQQCGYQVLTPVQEQAIIPARRGKDLLVNAQTGTGKTAAFALPILQQMLDQPTTSSAGKVRAMVLTPTRELAEQLARTIGNYAQYTDLTIAAIFGGVKLGGQANRLKSGLDLLIATPGRLQEHLELGHVNLADVEFVVLDEADRMLDMGFIEDAQQLISQTNPARQTLLFSATTTPAMNELAHKILNNHQAIRLSKANATADTVEHVLYPVEESRKLDLFMALLEQHNWFQILVFTSTRKQADHLLARMKHTAVKAAICHGDKSQGSRRRALADFKAAKIQVLIATEVAARGIDIEGLEHVLNYNLPYLPEDYVHRIGRTGRAGKAGHAISFVCPEEAHVLHRIERVIGTEVKRIYQKGFELTARDISSTRQPSKPQSARSKKSQTDAKHSKPSGKNKQTRVRGKKKSISARAGGKKNRKAIKKNR